MKRERQMTDDLLVKYLLGEVPETEQAGVEEWMRESPENKNEFDSFRLIWEQSRLAPVAAPVDTDAAWERFQQKIAGGNATPKTIALPARYKWLKVAAVFLLFAGASWFALRDTTAGSGHLTAVKQPEHQAIITNKPALDPVVKPAAPTIATVGANETPGKEPGKKSAQAPGLSVSSSHQPTAHQKFVKSLKNYYSKGNIAKTKINGFICNSTPYPFEICITQSLKCKSTGKSAVSTCSVLEPDQSGQLRYKAFNKIAKNCNTTIEEIIITKITTGETIVLNDHSSPTTAQNFFNHITGKKKGDVFAGMFHCDGNERSDDCGLTFNSSFGNLSMQ